MADGWLQPYSRQIRDRQRLFDLKMKRIHQRAGSLEEYARGYRYYGFNKGTERRRGRGRTGNGLPPPAGCP